MKFTLVFALAIIVVLNVASSQANQNTDSQWEKYKKDFNKKYSSPADEALHRGILEKNVAKVAEHNAKFAKGEVTYSMGINNFSDMTPEELSKHHGLGHNEHHH
ncbi:hypothetical protein WA026_023246 [Henosepilachna vigintioctopunctata]|uniref:Cathepsin propeptide inhibitor domain-containing protein n=1 Tax=Henosepilachna vigintioctopunctata TaxID=420089 RepID=A0AAW1UWM9_9CUCU